MIEPLYLDFFIECAAVIDNHIDIISESKTGEHKNRKQLQDICTEISEIYHWRDKFAAHHDLDALGYGLCGTFDDWKNHITHMKELLNKVLVVCKDNLPSGFQVDYLVHDAVAYRLVHRVNKDCEEQIYNTQHPFRNIEYNKTDGFMISTINSIDDACRYLRSRNVFSNSYHVGCIRETGINKEETLQNLQRQFIIINVLYDKQIWVSKGETWDDKLLDTINNNIIKFVTKP